MTVLRVLEPGPASVVHDLGRPGREPWGVAPSGAFDRGAHDRAQRLVGNASGAAGLEVLLGGLVVAWVVGVCSLGSARKPRLNRKASSSTVSG